MIVGAAAGLLALTWMLCGNVSLASMAVLGLVLYPASISLMVDMYAEPAAIFALTVGICLILRGGPLVYAGAAVLGLVPLARPNFAILSFTFAVAAVDVRRRSLHKPHSSTSGLWRRSGAVLRRKPVVI